MVHRRQATGLTRLHKVIASVQLPAELDIPILELSEKQAVELNKQLPPEKQRAAPLALAEGAAGQREERMRLAEVQLRCLASERGRDWDKMSEDDREAFVDALLHEDRQCGA